MTWEIRIPYRSLDQRLDDPGTLHLSEALENPEERAVADRLIVGAMADPSLETVGDLIARIEEASPTERRRIGDAAREQAGLESFTTLAWKVDQEHRRRAPRSERDGDGRIEASCAHPGCSNFQPEPATGLPAMVAVRSWWCPEHRHLAAEGDMKPYSGTRLVYNEVGVLVDPDEEEREALRAKSDAARIKQEREQKLAERRARAAELREHENAQREADAREFPDGLIAR